VTHPRRKFPSPCLRVLLSCALVVLFTATASSCLSTGEKQRKELAYWTAPDIDLSRFEKHMVEEWNSTHPESRIDWKTIPAGTTSEEVILTAVATGTGPDICGNIFGGFAAQLADAGVLVALDTLPGFWELTRERRMEGIIRRDWIYGGHVYVLPVYVNPMLILYNRDLLALAGKEKPPRTYSEFLALADKVRKARNVYALPVDVSSKWYRRWFDYLTLYAAASGGRPYVDVQTGKAYFDSKAGKTVAEFFFRLFNEGYVPRFDIPQGFEKGSFLAAIRGARDVLRIQRMFPDFSFTIGPVLVPDDFPEDSLSFTLAESKGMVLFNTTRKKREAWEFMQWYFSGNHDSLWLEMANFLPVREDLLTNPYFQDYFHRNPEMMVYARAMEAHMSLVLSSRTVELQTILTRELWQPIVFGVQEPSRACRDANKAIERLLRSGPI
jgi:multiple sugar transport system substrate-binding protein